MKLLTAGPAASHAYAFGDPVLLTWRSVEDLVHAVLFVGTSTLVTRCMLPDLKKCDGNGYVYAMRRSAFLSAELGYVNDQPITCLWCATDQWRP